MSTTTEPCMEEFAEAMNKAGTHPPEYCPRTRADGWRQKDSNVQEQELFV